MDLKTTNIDGRIVDVISEDEYKAKWEAFDNTQLTSSTAVEVAGVDGRQYILPFRGKNDDRPGIYQDGSIYFIKSSDEYATDNLDVIDFSDVSTVQDFMAKNQQIRTMETNILTDVDSVFAPAVMQDDSPEMKAFKEAICSKHIDINKYAPRFGDNFLNDKRILKANSITLNKLVSMCDKLDIEAELSLRDTSPNVANPMGKEIRVILTRGEGDGEE